jgi:hypothetical protein
VPRSMSLAVCPLLHTKKKQEETRGNNNAVSRRRPQRETQENTQETVVEWSYRVDGVLPNGPRHPGAVSPSDPPRGPPPIVAPLALIP